MYLIRILFHTNISRVCPLEQATRAVKCCHIARMSLDLTTWPTPHAKVTLTCFSSQLTEELALTHEPQDGQKFGLHLDRFATRGYRADTLLDLEPYLRLHIAKGKVEFRPSILRYLFPNYKHKNWVNVVFLLALLKLCAATICCVLTCYGYKSSVICLPWL